MKNVNRLLILAIIGFAVMAVKAQALSLGEALPASTTKMLNVDGKETTLAELPSTAGKLVIFSCNECPYARKWEERIVAIGNEYKTKGIGVAVINANDPKNNAGESLEKMQARAKAKGYQFPYLVDGTSAVARAFAASRTPEAFLFNKEGKLVYHGAIDNNADNPKAVTKPYLRNALEAVVATKSVDAKESETKSIGCSIKFRN